MQLEEEPVETVEGDGTVQVQIDIHTSMNGVRICKIPLRHPAHGLSYLLSVYPARPKTHQCARPEKSPVFSAK